MIINCWWVATVLVDACSYCLWLLLRIAWRCVGLLFACMCLFVWRRGFYHLLLASLSLLCVVVVAVCC